VGDVIIHNTSIEQTAEKEVNKKYKAAKIFEDENTYSLTYKQQLKRDAILWAEFLYVEYKEEKAFIEEGEQW